MTTAVWLFAALVASIAGIGAYLVASRREFDIGPEPEPLPSAPPPAEKHVPEGDEDITLVTLRLDPYSATPAAVPPAPAPPPTASAAALPPQLPEELPTQPDDGPAALKSSARPIVVDDLEPLEEPTGPIDVILVSAVGQTDRGLRRKRNEDRYLVLPEHYLFAVADGMGGYAGGEVASQMAVDELERAFVTNKFEGGPYPGVPRLAGDLAAAIHMANRQIRARALEIPALSEMGTTVVAARFSPRKERVYIGHVGDSRAYRYRNGRLVQLTTDHTMANEYGVTGRVAEHLTQAVGVGSVRIDIVIAEPHFGDLFLLCSDGLSKMAKADDISAILASTPSVEDAANALIERAKAGGGKDNITVIVIRVDDARKEHEKVPDEPAGRPAVAE